MEELPASGVATFSSVSAAALVIVMVGVESYVFVDCTTREPPIVTVLVVMFDDRVNCVSV